MQYLLMIYRNEAELGKMDAAARKQMTAEYGAFTQSIIQSGHFKAGDGLQPTSTATTVRVRAAAVSMVDGPARALALSMRWRPAASSKATNCCRRSAPICLRRLGRHDAAREAYWRQRPRRNWSRCAGCTREGWRSWTNKAHVLLTSPRLRGEVGAHAKRGAPG